MTVHWSGVDGIKRRMKQYEQKIIETIHLLAMAWAPILERHAKENAPWTDRTGAARQGLQGLVEDMATEAVVSIVLKGGVYYQVFLELANQGRYSIILPTIRQHQGEFMEDLRKIVGQ